MTKIIFLDLDGVILPWNSKKLPPNFPQQHPLECALPSGPISLVNRLAASNNAQIVISSTWRMRDKDLDNNFEKDVKPFDLRSFLKRSGLTAKFAADWHTPLPTRFSEVVYGRPRGFEINEWLENHKNEVQAWVALDDDSAGFAEKNIENHLVRLNPYQCFQQTDYARADKILKGDLDG